MFDYADMQKATREHFEHPQKGDRFHEMYSFWVYVWDILADGTIVTHQASPPCEFPKDAKVVQYADKENFRAAFEDSAGFTVLYVDTGTYHAPDLVQHDCSAMFNLTEL